LEQAAFFTRPRVVFALASLCCLLWGSAYSAIKTGYSLLAIERGDVAAQLLFAGLRFVLAGGLLLAFTALRGKPIGRMARTHGLQLAALGVAQTTLQYLFFYVGLAHTTGVKASILGAVNVFFSVLVAHWLHADDRLTRRTALGCAVGFGGVLLVNLGALSVQPGAATGSGFSLLGEGFVVISALAGTLAAFYGKRLSQHMDAVVMTGYQLGLGGVVLLALGAAGGGALHAFSAASLALLFYLAGLSAAAFAIWGVLLKYNRVSAVSIFSFLVPIFGASLSALFLGESLLEWKYLLALLLVSLGIWWVSQDR